MFKEVNMLKMRNGKEVPVKLFIYNSIQDAINCKWDSLVFGSNEDSFISLDYEGYCFSLVTNGDIAVTDVNNGINYTNSDFKNLKELAISEEIYSDNYIIDSSNSFQIEYGSIIRKDRELIEFERIHEPINFNEKPRTENELIDIFVNHAFSILESLPKIYTEIGEILEDGTIERGQGKQGLVYWSEEAFIKKEGICYVPELSDNTYTYDDFVAMANGNEDIAEELFRAVDWQHPESLYEEWLNSDEVHECRNCKKAYNSYDVKLCPYCGTKKEI